MKDALTQAREAQDTLHGILGRYVKRIEKARAKVAATLADQVAHERAMSDQRMNEIRAGAIRTAIAAIDTAIACGAGEWGGMNTEALTKARDTLRDCSTYVLALGYVDLSTRMGRVAEELTQALEGAGEPAKDHFGELCAMVFRDGGQHLAHVGRDAALEEAVAEVVNTRARLANESTATPQPPAQPVAIPEGLVVLPEDAKAMLCRDREKFFLDAAPSPSLPAQVVYDAERKLAALEWAVDQCQEIGTCHGEPFNRNYAVKDNIRCMYERRLEQTVGQTAPAAAMELLVLPNGVEVELVRDGGKWRMHERYVPQAPAAESAAVVTDAMVDAATHAFYAKMYPNDCQLAGRLKDHDCMRAALAAAIGAKP